MGYCEEELKMSGKISAMLGTFMMRTHKANIAIITWIREYVNVQGEMRRTTDQIYFSSIFGFQVLPVAVQ